jgi:hypothetical protein
MNSGTVPMSIRFISIMILTLLGALPTFADDSPYEGLTLFNHLSTSNTTFLINNAGETVHTWTGDGVIASTPYLMKGGDLIRPCRAQLVRLNGTAAGGRIQRISIEGQVVWDYVFSDSRNQQHHDICVMPNGNILLVAWQLKTNAEGLAAGRLNLKGEIWPTQIVEIEPVGSTSGNIVWRWELWDHIVQNVNPSLPNFGILSDYPERIDINAGEIQNGDWIHVNALDYNPELDQIVFSSNWLNEIFVIDHSTTTEEAAGSTGGNSGMGGDILFRWGNPGNYDRGDSSTQVLWNVHGVNWIDPGLVGENRLLLFNNGNDDGTSDLIEFMPPLLSDLTYAMVPGDPFLPKRDDYDWFYEQDGFWGGHLCGVYRLPNGNTLATDGPGREIREISPEGETIWVHFTDWAIMRADKYPMDILEPAVQCLGDMNGDGQVDGTDLSTLLAFWNLAGDADLNSDGLIDGIDLTILLGHWGVCP